MFSICGVLMSLTSAPRYDIDAALDLAQCHAELGQGQVRPRVVTVDPVTFSFGSLGQGWSRGPTAIARC